MGTNRFILLVAALVSTPVVAAAQPAAYPPAAYPAPAMPGWYYNWTGFYVGGHLGGGWAGSASGFLGGGQAGFNFQNGPWVVGAEWQMSATSIKDTTSASVVFPGFAVGSVRAEARLDWISTLAARIGWAFDRSLVYGKVGGAWTHVSVDATATVTSFAGVLGASVAADKTLSGWMLGIGYEYALWDNLTAKIEYDMMDFGQDFLADNKVHILKIGANYRFGYGPTPGVRY